MDKVILRMYPAIFGAKVTYHRFLINGIEAQPVIRSNDSVIEFSLKDGLKVGASIVLSIDLELQMPIRSQRKLSGIRFCGQLIDPGTLLPYHRCL